MIMKKRILALLLALTLLVLGGITTVTEWNQIRTSSVKKFVYVFTFPLFMFTYIPISLAAFISLSLVASLTSLWPLRALLTVATDTPQRTEMSFKETNDISAFP